MDIKVSEKLIRHICHHHRELRIYVSQTIPAVTRHSSTGRFGDYIVEKFFDDKKNKFGTHIQAA